MSITTATRPHVVCVPAPLQGHINPMLKLAKLLHHKGFHVTFVNTEYIHKRLLRSRGPNSLDGLPDFHFETITDGLPPVDADVSQDIIALAESTTKACLLPLCNLISKLNDTSSSNSDDVLADICVHWWESIGNGFEVKVRQAIKRVGTSRPE
ncbi:7-deoxyloganetin glucosyltransferase [Quercus suber]|uniref:7-deoxyloganetin glucosyltransferase n=1 Tax=Quercus suber TaxID=58331 RepID=A0AAW0JD63_QUESU